MIWRGRPALNALTSQKHSCAVSCTDHPWRRVNDVRRLSPRRGRRGLRSSPPSTSRSGSSTRGGIQPGATRGSGLLVASRRRVPSQKTGGTTSGKTKTKTNKGGLPLVRHHLESDGTVTGVSWPRRRCSARTAACAASPSPSESPRATAVSLPYSSHGDRVSATRGGRRRSTTRGLALTRSARPGYFNIGY